MTYVLYGDPGSGSAAVDLVLAEVGADVERQEIPLDREAQRHPVYAAINPQRKLPTLITPDGETLTESAAILLILAERFPAARLLPDAGTAERAQALRWLLYLAGEIYPVIEFIDYPERFWPAGEAPSESQREALRERGRQRWKQRWQLVENAADGEPWFLPGGFSLLDIYAAVVSRWAQVGEWRAVHLPRIERITSEVMQRSTLSDVWQRHFG